MTPDANSITNWLSQQSSQAASSPASPTASSKGKTGGSPSVASITDDSQNPQSYGAFLDTLHGSTDTKGITEDAKSPSPGDSSSNDLRDAFRDFVGQTFFGQMMKSLRSTQSKLPYLDGGRTEEIFQAQLDQVMTEKLSDATADQIADPMFELFVNPPPR